MRTRRKIVEDIDTDITPLIDVIFILLIFFMTTTVFKKDEAELLLKLPKAKDANTKKKKVRKLLIELSTKNLIVNGKKSSLKDLDNLSKKITNKSIPVELRVDKTLPYQEVVNILNVLHKNELGNLNLITGK